MGRPQTGIGPVIGVRLYPEMKAELDAWIADQPDPEAVQAGGDQAID